MDESAYFTNPSGGYSTLQGDGYTLAARGVDQRDPSVNFTLDFLPTGDTMPRAFPGASLDPSVTTATTTTSPGDPTAAFCDMDPSRALYNSRDSSEDCLNGNTHGHGSGPFDASYSFLPSPPDADEGATNTSAMTPAISPRQQVAPSFGADGTAEDMAAINKQRIDRKKRRRHSTPVVSTSANDSSMQGMDVDEKRRSTTQLRTASRAPKRYSQSTARKPAETPEEVKARAAHNQVEQQYRKRLNAQFERLLSVLPQPDYDEEGMDEEGGGEGSGRAGMEKRISKAEVLDLARRRIKLLEREKANLERQNEEMLENERRVQEEWTRRLGGPMPTVKIER
ncbi:uncharacterized protein DNG_06730 [Cephalotrichum gorgonifer]|uniref:BHLH domain-containing protein n=1 Tax=Cephalotrichum gorgonifer TaxID=2041049 RepID=A0AAE8N3B2_9PEZI|nr:uncharacterized protein DNG_06730 [Cephalotrichum gorgonifer]